MRLYVVRAAGTRRIHGIFWAETSADLWNAVSDMRMFGDFEHTELKEFGGTWRLKSLLEIPGIPERREFPDTIGGEEAFRDALRKAMSFGCDVFCEYLADVVAYQERYVWAHLDRPDTERVGWMARLRRWTAKLFRAARASGGPPGEAPR